MTYVIDYSAGKLTGAQIKAASYVGSIRYVPYDNSSNSKFATVSEVRSQIDAGLSCGLIFERDALDAQGGYAAGQSAANYIVNFASAASMQRRGYVAQDAWLNQGVTPSQVSSYVQGAASVLGWANTGIYGFYDTQNATASLPVAARWLCGSATNINNGTSLWQDNNFTGSVSGVAVDRNQIIKTDWLQTSNNIHASQGDNDMQLIYCDELKATVILAGGLVTGFDDASGAANPISLFPRLFVSKTVYNDLVNKSHLLEGILGALNQSRASTDAVKTSVDAVAASIGSTHVTGPLSISGTLNVQ